MRTIAIVGGGFGGAMVATHLLRTGGTRVLLFDRTGSFGPGLAYSTRSPMHLLNVPVGRMAALPDTPDDFLRWGLSQGHHWTGGTFAPRREYGKYLQDALNTAEALGRGVLERIAGEVVSCRPDADGVQVRWRGADARPAATSARAGGDTRRADGVLLALGNFPPAHPSPALATLPAPCYAADPWAAGALSQLDPTSPVLLVGTGLTMFDIVLALVERGHRGPIHALSRRGLLPQPHRAAIRPPTSHAPPSSWESWEPTARGLLREVRREVSLAARRGIDWREVITSLRSVTPQLWTSLPEPERARFLRHVRPFWEVVRHRSAPSVDGQIQELMLSGKLHIHSARIAAATLCDGTASGGVEVRIEPRGGAIARTLRVARVINCTGPDTDCRRIHSPLITQLREDGLAIECPLGQGLLTDDGARLIGRAGAVWENAWLIGPMAKGSAWEITAVPELREHAARIAEVLAAEPIASRERQT